MTVCICVPCTTPAYGAPGYDHCAACCAGSLISEYSHDCPVPGHSAMAVRQWGPLPMYPPGLGRKHGLADDTKRLVVAATPLLVRVLNRLHRWLQ